MYWPQSPTFIFFSFSFASDSSLCELWYCFQWWLKQPVTANDESVQARVVSCETMENKQQCDTKKDSYQLYLSNTCRVSLLGHSSCLVWFHSYIRLNLFCNNVLKRLLSNWWHYMNYFMHDLEILICLFIKSRNQPIKAHIIKKLKPFLYYVLFTLVLTVFTYSSLITWQGQRLNCSAVWLPLKEIKLSIVSSQSWTSNDYFLTDMFVYSLEVARSRKTVRRKHSVKTHPALHTAHAPEMTE